MDQDAKRLVLFAPDMPAWWDITDWDKVLHFPSNAGNGLSDLEYDQIISVILQAV